MKNLLLSLFTLSVLTSCASVKTLDQNSLQKMKSQKSIALVVGKGSRYGAYYKFGAQGLLEVALNAGFGQPIRDAIKKLDAQNLAQTSFKEKLQEQYQENGNLDFQDKYVDMNGWMRLKDKQKGQYKYDLSHLRNKGYKFAHILNVERFGASRAFWGVIPIRAPKGDARLNYTIVDLETKMIVGFQRIDHQTPVEGKWSQKPHYTNLINASKVNFENSVGAIVNKAFGIY